MNLINRLDFVIVVVSEKKDGEDWTSTGHALQIPCSVVASEFQHALRRIVAATTSAAFCSGKTHPRYGSNFDIHFCHGCVIVGFPNV